MPPLPWTPAHGLTLVGPGRLGGWTARRLRSAGVSVRVCGRTDAIPSAGLTWLTVPDRAIGAAALRVPSGGVVLHASGATDIEPLRPHRPAGSLHPLMTFPHPEAPVPDVVPAAVAGDPLAQHAARALADVLGFTPFPVPGDRRAYHAAAVLAGNFATTLLAEAAQVLTQAGVPAADAPALLAPLALASLANAAADPRAALTGPAARGDHGVLADHRAAIDALAPDVRPTYDALLAATQRLLKSGER